MGLVNDATKVANVPFDIASSLLELKPANPSQVVYWVVALVLGVYALNFLMPGTTLEHLNWKHVKNALSSASASALTLIPALSALVLPDTTALNYAFIGAGAYAVGLGISCIPKPACRVSGGTTSCTRTESAWYNLGSGLQTAGVSGLVGATVIYLQNMIASAEVKKINDSGE